MSPSYTWPCQLHFIIVDEVLQYHNIQKFCGHDKKLLGSSIDTIGSYQCSCEFQSSLKNLTYESFPECGTEIIRKVDGIGKWLQKIIQKSNSDSTLVQKSKFHIQILLFCYMRYSNKSLSGCPMALCEVRFWHIKKDYEKFSDPLPSYPTAVCEIGKSFPTCYKAVNVIYQITSLNRLSNHSPHMYTILHIRNVFIHMQWERIWIFP